MSGTSTQLVLVLLAAVFIALGCFLSWAIRRTLARRSQWLREAVVVTGRVVALEERFPHKTEDGSPALAPVVTFTAPGGNVTTFTSSTAQRPCPYAVGQEVVVRYLPNDPKPAELDSVARGRGFLVGLVVLAAACFAAAALIVFLRG